MNPSPVRRVRCGVRGQPSTCRTAGSGNLRRHRTATLLGPIAGAAIVVVMKNVASAYIERWTLVLGVIFILIISFMPEGLVPGSVRLARAAWGRIRLILKGARGAKERPS